MATIPAHPDGGRDALEGWQGVMKPEGRRTIMVGGQGSERQVQPRHCQWHDLAFVGCRTDRTGERVLK